MEDNKLKEMYNNVTNIKKDKLVSYLQCPICKGIFRSPMTINECMHTFCKTCIYKHFNSKNSSNTVVDYCPVCKIKLGGRPFDTLIFDNSISALIDVLFPEFEEIDKEATKKMYSTFHNNKQNLPGENDILKIDKPSVKMCLYPFKAENPSSLLPKLSTPVLILQPILNVETIKKYLASKLENVQPVEIEILYKNQVMPDNYTLKDISKLFNFSGDKNVLHYMKKIN